MSDRTTESYGQHGVSWVDRFGVWLSMRAIRRHLPTGNALRVLELGCGYRATQLMALRDRFKEGVGVDFTIAPELRGVPGVVTHEGTIEDVVPRLPVEAFDVVLLISVLEHLREPLSILTAVNRLLKPGGVLLVNVPTWRGKTWLEFSAFRLGLSPRVEMDDHKMYYDKRDLWPLLVRAGFRPSAIRLSTHKFGLNLFAVVRKSDHA
ncbi:MAG TPA: class I SAM-dependent methyltransferase [Lacunisphaera sp.]